MYASLPPVFQKTISDITRRMGEGMAKFAERNDGSGSVVIKYRSKFQYIGICSTE